MRNYGTVILLCLMSTCAFATQQVQDKLNYQGQVYEIGGNGNFPLEKYFKSCPKTDKIKMSDIMMNQGSIEGKPGIRMSTACYRGHIATWTIETNTLFLTNIKFLGEKTEYSADVLKPIFGDKLKESKLQVFWFNGHITLRGKNEILFFEKGKLIKTRAFNSNNEMYDADRALLMKSQPTNAPYSSPAAGPKR